MDWSALVLSFKLAMATVLVLLPIALLLGRWLAYERFVGHSVVQAAILLPLVLPPTVLGFYLLSMLGQASFIGRFFSSVGIPLVFNFLGLLVASLLVNIPFMVQPIQRAFGSIPQSLIEAAAVSGLNAWQIFRHVELPLAWPGIVSALMLTFVHTMGEFGVVLMMGGNIPDQTRTLSIAIYDEVQAFQMDKANDMSLVLLGLSVMAVAFSFFASSRFVFSPSSRR